MSLALVIALVLGLQQWHTTQFAITPGDATPVAPLVKIIGVTTNAHHDKIMLTDVYLQSLTAWQWLIFHFQSHVQFVGENQLVQPGIPADELGAQGFLQMLDAKQAAEVAAFQSLGWTIPATPTGAIVTGVVASSPARSAGLSVGDRIVGVNGTTLRTSCQLIRDVHLLAPGTKVKFSVERVKITTSGKLSWGRATMETVRTGVDPGGVGVSGCAGVSGSERSWIGIALEDGINYEFPARVTINTANIGGPSAGLAMALTLIDELSGGSLTGHHAIAATGTIDVNGNVGDVGGVAQKTVAVERAGASYFIVPQVEVATARGAASSALKVLGVTTLAQALRDLRALGGAKAQPLTQPS